MVLSSCDLSNVCSLATFCLLMENQIFSKKCLEMEHFKVSIKMDGGRDGWMVVKVDEWLRRWVHEQVDGWIYKWVDGWLDRQMGR